MNIIHKLAKWEAELESAERASQTNSETKTNWDYVDNDTGINDSEGNKDAIAGIVIFAVAILIIYGFFSGLKSAFAQDQNSKSCEYVTCGPYERCIMKDVVKHTPAGEVPITYPSCEHDETLKPDYRPDIPFYNPGQQYSPNCSQREIISRECPPL